MGVGGEAIESLCQEVHRNLIKSMPKGIGAMIKPRGGAGNKTDSPRWLDCKIDIKLMPKTKVL